MIDKLLALQDYSPKTLAMLASVFGGLIITFVWSESLYSLLYRWHPNAKKADRIRWVGVVSGLVERLFITALVLWQIQMVPTLAAAWLAITAISGWTREEDKGEVSGRARFQISMLNCLVSIAWAIACGLWATISSK